MSGNPEGAIFLSGSLMRHVVRMSLTSSVGLMAIFAVDFIDMVFISMLGNEALAAAVGYAGAVLFFTNSINIGLSIAAGSLVAREVGAGQQELAREYAASVAVVSIGVGLLVPVLVLFNLNWLLSLLGAEGEVLQLAADYLWIILPTMWVMGLAMTGMAILRAYGDARRSMLATLYGGVVNAALDPLFIFGLNLGLEGAAIASVVARFCMAVFALWPAIKTYQALKFPSIDHVMRDLKAVTGIALPAVATNLATPVGNAIVMREIAKFGVDAVAGMAIIGRLMPVAFAAIFALSGAIGPIIGQNFGAEKYQRVWGSFIDGIKFTAVYTLLVSLLLYLLRTPIAQLFEATGIAQSLIFLFCGPLALLFFFNGVVYVANASFNNLGHPVYSTWVNWGRHTLGTWPLAIAGGYLWGASGVLIGQAVGGIIFAAVAWLLVDRVVSNLSGETEIDHFGHHRRFHIVFGTRSW